jgi:hypothetical protein
LIRGAVKRHFTKLGESLMNHKYQLFVINVITLIVGVAYCKAETSGVDCTPSQAMAEWEKMALDDAQKAEADPKNSVKLATFYGFIKANEKACEYMRDDGSEHAKCLAKISAYLLKESEPRNLRLCESVRTEVLKDECNREINKLISEIQAATNGKGVLSYSKQIETHPTRGCVNVDTKGEPFASPGRHWYN